MEPLRWILRTDIVRYLRCVGHFERAPNCRHGGAGRCSGNRDGAVDQRHSHRGLLQLALLDVVASSVQDCKGMEICASRSTSTGEGEAGCVRVSWKWPAALGLRYGNKIGRWYAEGANDPSFGLLDR